MESYNVWDDIEITRELLSLSIEDLAVQLGIAESTIYRWKKDEGQISLKNLEAFYEFAYKKRIRLNKIKEQLFLEECPENHVTLFHGAKSVIEGTLTLERSKKTNDFGPGFYCGESLEQSAMFVSGYTNSSLYIIDFDKTGLRHIKLGVEQDWMLMIAYFRGKLNEYKNHPMILQLLSRLENIDYIIAPIADNRMFEIIDSFIDGEITDVQCRHCLSATNLGNQYVFISKNALQQLRIVRRCYLTASEKNAYFTTRIEEMHTSNDKAKIARKQYRNQGLYIEDILNEGI